MAYPEIKTVERIILDNTYRNMHSLYTGSLQAPDAHHAIISALHNHVNYLSINNNPLADRYIEDAFFNIRDRYRQIHGSDPTGSGPEMKNAVEHTRGVIIQYIADLLAGKRPKVEIALKKI